MNLDKYPKWKKYVQDQDEYSSAYSAFSYWLETKNSVHGLSVDFKLLPEDLLASIEKSHRSYLINKVFDKVKKKYKIEFSLSFINESLSILTFKGYTQQELFSLIDSIFSRDYIKKDDTNAHLLKIFENLEIFYNNHQKNNFLDYINYHQDEFKIDIINDIKYVHSYFYNHSILRYSSPSWCLFYKNYLEVYFYKCPKIEIVYAFDKNDKLINMYGINYSQSGLIASVYDRYNRDSLDLTIQNYIAGLNFDSKKHFYDTLHAISLKWDNDALEDSGFYYIKCILNLCLGYEKTKKLLFNIGLNEHLNHVMQKLIKGRYFSHVERIFELFKDETFFINWIHESYSYLDNEDTHNFEKKLIKKYINETSNNNILESLALFIFNKHSELTPTIKSLYTVFENSILFQIYNKNYDLNIENYQINRYNVLELFRFLLPVFDDHSDNLLNILIKNDFDVSICESILDLFIDSGYRRKLSPEFVKILFKKKFFTENMYNEIRNFRQIDEDKLFDIIFEKIESGLYFRDDLSKLPLKFLKNKLSDLFLLSYKDENIKNAFSLSMFDKFDDELLNYFRLFNNYSVTLLVSDHFENYDEVIIKSLINKAVNDGNLSVDNLFYYFFKYNKDVKFSEFYNLFKTHIPDNSLVHNYLFNSNFFNNIEIDEDYAKDIFSTIFNNMDSFDFSSAYSISSKVLFFNSRKKEDKSILLKHFIDESALYKHDLLFISFIRSNGVKNLLLNKDKKYVIKRYKENYGFLKYYYNRVHMFFVD